MTSARLRAGRIWRGIAVVLFALACGCRSEPTPVVLLTVDTLRADHLSFYGYARPTSRSLERLAREAVVFEHAFTTAPKTTPAYASMMTGRYPYAHGLSALGEALPAENRTLAELLAERGYATAGFVSSTVMVADLSELDQGFALWDDRLDARELHRENFERTAARTADRAIEWISEPRSSAPLLFVHWIDPHGPYTPPPAFLSRFRRNLSGERLVPAKIPGFQRLEWASTLSDYVDAYDAEIAYADAAIGRVLDALRAADLYDRSLIIVTADHGESLGEEGVYFRHGVTLDESSLRVPLIVKPPAGSPGAGSRVEGEAVSLVDILPTVADYLGVDAPRGIDGRSLRPLIESSERDAARVVFSVRRVGARTHVAAQSSTSAATGVYERSNAVADTFAGSPDLRPALDAFAVRRTEHRRGFSRRVIYRPRDSTFVKEFFETRSESADLSALRSLGYVE